MKYRSNNVEYPIYDGLEDFPDRKQHWPRQIKEKSRPELSNNPKPSEITDIDITHQINEITSNILSNNDIKTEQTEIND